jgi:RNA polymerase sigma-70 factor (ECF subfamily)
MGLPASFADLAERHRPELLGYLVRLLGDQHDAQDACQDALLRAHRAFDRLAPDSNCRAWLYRIATNSARDVARRRSRRRARTAEVDLDTLPAAAPPAPDRGEQLRAVTRAVEALPRRQREALLLRQFQGLPYEEIAATLGGNAAAARANVYQAVKKLRATLGGTR